MSSLLLEDVQELSQIRPSPAEAGLDYDSVDQLECYMNGLEITEQDWIDHCLPWAARA